MPDHVIFQKGWDHCLGIDVAVTPFKFPGQKAQQANSNSEAISYRSSKVRGTPCGASQFRRSIHFGLQSDLAELSSRLIPKVARPAMIPSHTELRVMMRIRRQ